MIYRNFAALGAKAFAAALFLLATGANAAPATTTLARPSKAQPALGVVQAGEKPALPALNEPVVPDDPAKVAAAKEYLAISHPRMDPKGAPATIDKMMPRFVASEQAENPKLDVKKFEQQKRAELMSSALQQFDLEARVVSRHFTLPELKGLTAFYRGPLGQKLVAEAPKIQKEIFLARRMQANAGLAPGVHVLNVQKAPADGKAPAQPPHK